MAKLITQIVREELAKDRLGNVTVIKHAQLVDVSRYTGEKLREIRARKGVGRPPRQKAAS